MTGRDFDPKLDGQATFHSDIRNPWHGIDAWKEFKYDVRHPVKFVRCCIANVNHVSKEQRLIGKLVCGVGGANVLLGLVAIAFSYLR